MADVFHRNKALYSTWTRSFEQQALGRIFFSHHSTGQRTIYIYIYRHISRHFLRMRSDYGSWSRFCNTATLLLAKVIYVIALKMHAQLYSCVDLKSYVSYSGKLFIYMLFPIEKVQRLFCKEYKRRWYSKDTDVCILNGTFI